MTTLESLVRAHIAQHGPMPFQQFMEWCMRHPEHGYYITRDPLGQTGDFTTSPEVSQMFGEMVALWCYDVWVKMGEPAAFVLLECGPGRGTLMDDVLRTCKVMPAFLQAARIFMLEKSPVLQKKQAEKLNAYPVSWVDDLAGLPPLPVILFANELFDTFAIRRFTKTRAGWREMAITVENGALAYTQLPANSADKALFADKVYTKAETGAYAEFCPDGAQWMHRLAPLLAQHNGAALMIDYGYEGPMAADTVQAIRRQEKADILGNPGDADITAYVDFSVFCNIAKAAGLTAHPLRAQRDFLLFCGILQRANLLKQRASIDQQKQIDRDLNRLTSGEEMGMIFKAFCITHPSITAPLGF